MPCYHPLKGYRSKHINATGKRSIVFKKSEGFSDFPIEVPCGRCIGCRLERSRQWAMRCLHEASLYPDNSFITLTYKDEKLPLYGSLDKSHFQKFIKRLRREYPEKKFKYFMCGEYGERHGRPHYHACLFNFDFSDRVLFRDTDGVRLYTSEILSSKWPDGFSLIGDVTFESAAYVARYVTKKVVGVKAPWHYNIWDEKTGEIRFEHEPEYCASSLKPAIGKDWYEKFSDDVHNYDHCIFRGREVRPPKYYDRLLEKANAELARSIKLQRGEKAKVFAEDNTSVRNYVKEAVAEANFKLLKRSYENA